MSLEREVLARLSSVVRAETHSFVALAKLAGIDPATGFCGADLRGVDFGEDDLTGFWPAPIGWSGGIFSGAWLRVAAPRPLGQGETAASGAPA